MCEYNKECDCHLFKPEKKADVSVVLTDLVILPDACEKCTYVFCTDGCEWIPDLIKSQAI